MLGLARSAWPASTGPVRPEDVIAGIIAWSAVALSTWLAAGTLLVTLAALPGAVGSCGRRLADAITPALLRRGVSLLVGVGVGTVALPTGPALGVVSTPSIPAAGPTVPAGLLGWSSDDAPSRQHGRSAGWSGDPALPPLLAQDDPAASTAEWLSPAFRPTSTAPRDAAAPDPRWLPTRPRSGPDVGASRLLAPPPRPGSAPDATVTVRRGDSLWSIAARYLGPTATDAEVAAAWPAWYARNAETIGGDPDLIQPGLQLRIPTGDGPR